MAFDAWDHPPPLDLTVAANTTALQKDEELYDAVVYMHLGFGLTSVLGAAAVYFVYHGLPQGRLDPARCECAPARNVGETHFFTCLFSVESFTL